MATLQFKLAGSLNFVTEEPPSLAGALVTVQFDRFAITARGEKMAYVLPADKGIRVKVSWVDGHGNPAAVDGDVTWDASDTNIASIEVDSADTSQAWIGAVGQAGTCQINATADADLGEGRRELVCTMDLQIVSGEAVAGTIEPVGEPSDVGPYSAPPRSIPRR
jgi:hypothetical protein